MNSNLLVGSLPSTMSSLTSLVSLSLSFNQLTGMIPNSIGEMTSLLNLDLESNSFVGTIPAVISQLEQMSKLVLRSNYITMGTSTSLPTATFSNTTSSGYLDLSFNCLVYRSPAYTSQDVDATHCLAKTCKFAMRI
jgi:Leucine-rich repeat (LRR) protein